MFKTKKIAIVADYLDPKDRKGVMLDSTDYIYMWQILAKYGISPEDCYRTTIFKQTKPRSRQGLYEDRARTKPSIKFQLAIDNLKKELESNFQGNVILALGEEPLFALTGNKGIANWRGSIIPTDLGKVIPTFHPSIIHRQYDFLPRIAFDLGRLVKESEFKEANLPNPELIVKPTLSQIRSLSQEILSSAEFLSFDIETIQHHIDCIGFSWREDIALCIPLCYTSGENYWLVQGEEEEVWEWIAKLMESPHIKKIAQNATYDITYLKRYGVGIENLWLDTMNAHHTIYPEFPKGLDFLVSIYTRYPYHKDKMGISRWEYNALDAVTTYAVAMEIEKELKTFGTHSFYHDFINKLIIPYMEVQNEGVKCDLKVKREAIQKIEEEEKRLAKEIEEIVGYPLNPNSPKQLQKYFYEERGYKPYINRKTGKPTTNEEALLRIKRRDGDLAVDPILEYRAQTKLKGFLKTKVDADGRIRTAYIISGTKTGRLASKEHVYGSGTNLQNIPRGVPREMFIAEEGNVLIGADLSQAEARIVACLSKDPNLIELFSSRDRDIHSENAALIFGGNPDDYKGTEERQIAKKTTHAANYDISYKSYSLDLGIPEREGKRILEAYHNLYPGIRRYHRWVQEELRRTRTLVTPWGRKRQFFSRWGDSLFKEAYAFIPQSTVADLINKGFLNFYENVQKKGLAKVRLQVHDALYVECKESDREEVTQLLIQAMEIPMVINGFQITIPAEANWGNNWNEIG